VPQANRLKLPSLSAKRQAENKTIWNEARCPEDAQFFTIGYTGRPLSEIIDLLVSHSVRTLVDIRQFAVSMYRPELSKKNLKQSIEELGMLYNHFPELGVPRDIRAKAIETGTREVIWNWYDDQIISSYIGSNLHWFLNTIEHPVALMCVEIDPRECHRHRLFMALERMGLRGFDL
jgi:uncharacterized protein (DUF488 family)